MVCIIGVIGVNRLSSSSYIYHITLHNNEHTSIEQDDIVDCSPRRTSGGRVCRPLSRRVQTKKKWLVVSGRLTGMNNVLQVCVSEASVLSVSD